MRLKQHCEAKLREAQEKIEKISLGRPRSNQGGDEGGGTLEAEPFDAP